MSISRTKGLSLSDFSKIKINQNSSKHTHTHTHNASVSLSTKVQISSSGLLSVNAKRPKALCVVTTDATVVHNILYLEKGICGVGYSCSSLNINAITGS